MERLKDSPGRLKRHPVVRMILGAVAVYGIPVLANTIIMKPVFSWVFSDHGIADALRYLTALFLFRATYKAYVAVFEKRPASELGLAGMGKNIGLGIALAGGAMGLILVLSAAAGIYAIEGVNSGFDWVRIPAVIAVLAFGEELVFRGILYRIAEQAFGILPALAASAAVFGGLHLVNPGARWTGFVSAALGGIIAGLLYAWRRNLWLCASFHAGWNLVQTVFGSNVSGEDSFGAFFKGTFSGSDLLTGGAFGIEASLITLIVLAALAAGLSLTLRRC